MTYPYNNQMGTDFSQNFSQNFSNWSSMMESKYPFLRSTNGVSTFSGAANNSKPSAISSLFGGGESNYSFGNIMQGVGTVSTIDSMLSPLTDMLAGQNQSTVGNVMKAIPGLSTIGGLVNAAFGSHINKDFVDATNRQINYMRGPISRATTNESLLNDYENFLTLSNVKKSQVGSDGWFSHKAKKKTRALNSAIDAANIRAEQSMLNTAQNVDSNNDLMTMGNYAAYGGPLGGGNYYDWGGAILMAQRAIKSHEGWRNKTYKDTGGTRTIGWGFTDSGFRSKYKEGITNHYKRGMTQAQAQQELNWYLKNAANTLDKLYGQYNLTNFQKAALLDTYYQRPASVSKNSRFYKALKAGDKNAVKYLGVSGYNKRNAARQAMYSQGRLPEVSTDYTAPSDNTRVARPAVDFTIPKVTAFDNISVEQSSLPEIKSLLSNPSVDNYLFASLQRPTIDIQQPQFSTTEQIMNNYDRFFDSLGDISYLAEGGNLQGLQGLNNWLGQATTAANTISNWGKEDPSLGRNYGSGKYGTAAQAGMMTYDFIKAIRDATKSHRDTPMEKLGLFDDGGHLYAGGGAMDYANLANSVLKLASNVKAQASINDTSDVENGISSFSRSLDDMVADVNTNDDILNLYDTAHTIDTRLSGRDIRNKSYFDDFLSSVPASFEGFSAGSTFGPWGAAIGAVVGGASSLIGSAVGRHKANKKARELNKRIEEANQRVMHNLDYAVDRVDEQNDLRALQNYSAMGGKLNKKTPVGDPFGFGSNPGLSGAVWYLTNPHSDGGSIHIAPSKRGTFKAQASRMGMGVQEAASHILAHKDDYSPAMVKKAVFAHNFAHADGGPMGLIDFFAEGGSTHGADFSNGLTSIDEGGTHEENPLGGVPMGVDPNGTPNLVEEGETIWKGDYVFSDRLKVPEELRKKYHLKEGATYADASKELSKESNERPNDVISQRTLNVALGELSDAQEAERQTKAEAEASKVQQEENIAGQQILSQLSQGQNPQQQMSEDDMIAALNGVGSMAFGGNLFAPGGNLTPYNPYTPDFKDPLLWGFTLGKNSRVAEYSPEYQALVNKLTADDVRKWAKDHPDDPSLKDYLNRGNKLENLTDAQWRKGATDGRYGFMHRVASQLGNPALNKVTPPEEWRGFPYTLPMGYETPKEPLTPWEKYAAPTDDDTQIEPSNTKSGNTGTTPQTGGKKSNYKNTYMRYAPIIGNFALALNSIMNDPDYSNPNAIIRAAEVAGRPVSLPVDVIGDYRTRKPFDERYLTNIINQNNAAAIRAGLDIAGGNRAMGLASILANNSVAQARLAEAARQAYLANRADDMQVSEFNRGTNMFNAEANNRRNSTQAQLNSQRQASMLSGLARGYAMRQALDDQRAAAISQNLSAALQGLGDMGWENSQRNWLQALADRGVLKGMFNSDGTTDFAGISNPSTTTNGSKKQGGKIKTKKRRF